MQYEFEQWVKDNSSMVDEYLRKDKKCNYTHTVTAALYDAFVAGYNLGTHR